MRWPTNPRARRPVAANPASTLNLMVTAVAEMKSNTKSCSYFGTCAEKDRLTAAPSPLTDYGDGKPYVPALNHP